MHEVTVLVRSSAGPQTRAILDHLSQVPPSLQGMYPGIPAGLWGCRDLGPFSQGPRGQERRGEQWGRRPGTHLQQHGQQEAQVHLVDAHLPHGPERLLHLHGGPRAGPALLARARARDEAEGAGWARALECPRLQGPRWPNAKRRGVRGRDAPGWGNGRGGRGLSVLWVSCSRVLSARDWRLLGSK